MAQPWEQQYTPAAPSGTPRLPGPRVENLPPPTQEEIDQQNLAAIQALMPKPPEEERGFFDSVGDNAMSFARQAQNALTFGAADEISGGVAGLTSLLTEGDFGAGYDRVVDEYRRASANDWAEHPTASWTGTGAGILATGAAGATPRVASILYGAKAPGFVRGVLTNAGVGAGIGGVAGYMNGDSADPIERLKSAILGSLYGGALGGGVAAAIPAGRALWDVLPLAFGRRAPEAVADKLIGTAVARDTAGGTSPVTSAAAAPPWPGQPLALADMGPNLTRLTRTATTAPGESNAIADTLLAPRMGERSDRIVRAIDDTVGPGWTLSADRDILRSWQRAQAGIDYPAAYAAPALSRDALGAFGNQRAIADAYAVARRIADAEGIALPATMPAELNWRTLDLMKRALDDMVEVAARRTGTIGPTEANALSQLRDDFRGFLTSTNPEYGAALANFAGPAGVQDAMRLGLERFMRSTPEEIAAAVAQMPPEALAGYQQGVARALQGLAMRTENVNPNLLANPIMTRRLQAAGVDQAKLDQLMQGLAAERRMRETEGKILGGSPTASRLAETGDSIGQIQEGAGFLKDAASGNIAGVLTRALDAARRTTQGISPEAAAIIVRELLSRDPQMQAALFQRLVSSAAGAGGGGPGTLDRILLGNTFGTSDALGIATAAARK